MPAERRPRSAAGRLMAEPYGRRPQTLERVTRVRVLPDAPPSPSPTIPLPMPASTLINDPNPGPTSGAIQQGRMPWDIRLFLRDQRLAQVPGSSTAGSQPPASSSIFVLPDARQGSRPERQPGSRLRASSLPPMGGRDRLRRVRAGGVCKQKAKQSKTAPERGRSSLPRRTINSETAMSLPSGTKRLAERPTSGTRRSDVVVYARPTGNGRSGRPSQGRLSGLQRLLSPSRRSAQPARPRGGSQPGNRPSNSTRPARAPLSDLSGQKAGAASGQQANTRAVEVDRETPMATILDQLRERVEETYEDPSLARLPPLPTQGPVAIPPAIERPPLAEIPMNVLRNGGMFIGGRFVAGVADPSIGPDERFYIEILTQLFGGNLPI